MQSSAPLRLAVFDCDGTLVDSQHSIFAAMSSAFEACGLPAPLPEQVRRIIGLPLADACAALMPASIALDPLRLVDGYKDAFIAARTRPDFEEPLYPGAVAALDALESAGYLLGIATGKGLRGLERTLDRHCMLHRFVTVQTSDSGPGKPHPDMLRRALAETGVEAAACVMIGDTTFDVLMARAAGTRAVGVGWGYHPPGDLAAAGADAVVAAFPELAAVVQGLLP